MSIKIADKHIDKALEDLYDYSIIDNERVETIKNHDLDLMSKLRYEKLEDTIQYIRSLRGIRRMRKIIIKKHQLVIIEVFTISIMLFLFLFLTTNSFIGRHIFYDAFPVFRILSTVRIVTEIISLISFLGVSGTILSIYKERKRDIKNCEGFITSSMKILREYDKALQIPRNETLETIKKAIR